jgi:hypothetical protein
LASRPYDLRHAAASLWLNNGIPATEIARRLGQDVAVLFKSYVNCIDGQKGRSITGSPPLSRSSTTRRHRRRQRP